MIEGKVVGVGVVSRGEPYDVRRVVGSPLSTEMNGEIAVLHDSPFPKNLHGIFSVCCRLTRFHVRTHRLGENAVHPVDVDIVMAALVWRSQHSEADESPHFLIVRCLLDVHGVYGGGVVQLHYKSHAAIVRLYRHQGVGTIDGINGERVVFVVA